MKEHTYLCASILHESICKEKSVLGAKIKISQSEE